MKEIYFGKTRVLVSKEKEGTFICFPCAEAEAVIDTTTATTATTATFMQLLKFAQVTHCNTKKVTVEDQPLTFMRLTDFCSFLLALAEHDQDTRALVVSMLNQTLETLVAPEENTSED